MDEKFDFRNGTWQGGGSSSNNNYNDDISVTANRTSTTTNQWVNVTVETDSSYRGRVEFSLQYRSSNSSSWSTVSSSTYFTASSEFNNGYRFTSSDRGEKTFNSFIRFNRSGYYRLYIKDDNRNEDYVQFDVDTSSSNNNDDISISTNRTSPTANQWVNVTVETDSSYRGWVEFSLQYRSSSSSSRSTVSSSTYFTASSEFNNGYKFTSSDKGEKTFNSFIRFNKSGYYRLYVKDDNRNEDYVQFSVDTSSSNNNDDISISTNRPSPTTSQWVNVTVETDSSYRGRVEFSLQYRSSTSSSWSTVSSSTYFTANSEFNNGYKFTSSDKGEKTFNSFIRFNKSGYYRLYVKDDNRNENYVQFNVGGTSNNNGESNVKGFTVKELDKVTKVHKIWRDVITELKKGSKALKNDSYWTRLSDNFYDNMGDVINDRKNREFSNYRDFLDAFNVRFKYTSRYA
ncbi:MAG: hypothetical protein LBI53_04185 [Candidatus Peribacteria bacterium]|jgi:hypothetical protein|nr:hypothetical protein [Candidatus Peribacteria bacterium]